MNIPTDEKKEDIPDEAQGNPVYEQTRQDMPLFCCGKNCGRNSRITVMVLAIIGIVCSVIVCSSHKYFKFEAVRNDTFCDLDKQQPSPFEYARIANVGLFRYEIVEVVEYPWPEPEDDDYECAYFQLRRTRTRSRRRTSQENQLFRQLQNDTASGTNVTVGANETAAPGANATDPPVVDATDAPVAVATEPPTEAVTEMFTAPPLDPRIPLPGVGAGLDGVPTATPTSAPTMSDPNDKINVVTNEVFSYPDVMDQFDSVFRNAQRGAVWAPVCAFIGILFGLIELCCCLYKCSWLPTALFLYVAFMLQTLTLFLFLSDDFCKYSQDCKLGYAGVFTVIAVICYMIANTLVCCTPRPNPCFNCNKKPPVRRKKTKKKKPEDDDDESWDEEGNPRPRGGYGDEDGFDDEPIDQRQPLYQDDPGYYDDGYADPNDNYSYASNSVNNNDMYSNDNDTYGGDTYGDNNTYGGEIENGTKGDDDESDEEEDDEEDEEYDEDAWDTDEEDDDDEKGQR